MSSVLKQNFNIISVLQSELESHLASGVVLVRLCSSAPLSLSSVSYILVLWLQVVPAVPVHTKHQRSLAFLK